MKQQNTSVNKIAHSRNIQFLFVQRCRLFLSLKMFCLIACLSIFPVLLLRDSNFLELSGRNASEGDLLKKQLFILSATIFKNIVSAKTHSIPIASTSSRIFLNRGKVST